MAVNTEVYSPYGKKGKRAYIESQFAALKTERSSFDAHWQELARFLMPRRTRFWSGDRNKGDRRNREIIDSTGTMSARTLRSGMHAGLTSPARPWFKLGTPDPELARFGPVKEWLHDVTQRMLTVFATSNVYNSLPTVYGDMGVFGTAACAMLGDDLDLLRTYTYPIGSYVVGLDERGLATSFMREYEMTVRQIVAAFGGENGGPAVKGKAIEWENISTAIRKLWDSSNYEAAVPMLWSVTPNVDADGNAIGSKFFPWASCHLERDSNENQKILRESGFKTFPVFCPRWDVTSDDSYGTDCPGMTALGDVKQLQAQQRDKGRAVEKLVDPPLVGPNALRTQKTSLLPGDITYVDTRDGVQGLRAIHEVGLNIQHLVEDMRETQYRIDRAFFADLFLMMARSDNVKGGAPVTAREIEERHEEKLLVLGPVLERTNDELLNPMIDRAFALMQDGGLIPEAPPELHGVRLKIDYISLLAQAQRLVGVVGQDRFMQTVIGMAETFPEAKAKVNTNRIIDNYGEMLGVDPQAIVSDEAANQMIADARRQQAAQAAAETAASGAAAMKDASEAQLTGDSALTRMVNQLQGQQLGTGTAA